MELIGRIAQAGSALWIYNVWLRRFNKDTGYRGGNATNMREEFEEYGLSGTSMYAVGATKLGLATLMLAGLFSPRLARPASTALAALMLGAIGMHAKVGDPARKALPAMSVLAGAAVAAATVSSAARH